MPKLFTFRLLIFVGALSCMMQPAVAAEQAPVVHQLRIYEIFEQNKQANAAAAKAAEAEAAKRQAAYEAEVQRVRDLERQQQEDYAAKLRELQPD